MTIPSDILDYESRLEPSDKGICEILRHEIAKNLSEATSKVWHGHPVWFLDGNPIVGYHKLKDSVRVLFWSGQSFKSKGLKKEGSFKAAEVHYTEVGQIKKAPLNRWLKESKDIQWDYKNIVKRKGLLKKIK